MNNEQNACLDRPSPLDYKASEILGAIIGKGREFPLDILEIFNQGADSDTLMSCTRQGLGNITNGNNLLGQNSQDVLLGKKEWMKAVALKPEIKDQGDYLQNALKQYLDDKLISGYYTVSTNEEHKAAIDKGHFIYSGSNNGDWTSVRDNKLYKTKSNSSGHAFVKGVGYNDNGLIGINSYGNGNGTFTIPWELCNTTFTSYAIIDFVDEEEIKLFNKRKMEERKQHIIDLGISNGSNPDMNITRNEVMLMLGKLVELIENKVGKLN